MNRDLPTAAFLKGIDVPGWAKTKNKNPVKP
jgi:hypothetical protein